ncbi:MAG: serine hydrolase, partial [Saprospiraceae bacterium]|nr:serine hydrolase [Saprospiraceae bacterium]
LWKCCTSYQLPHNFVNLIALIFPNECSNASPMKKTMILNLLLISFCFHVIIGQNDSFEWNYSTPETTGMSSQLIGQLAKDLEIQGTKKFMIIKDDHLIYEWFAPGWADTARTHYSASLAKALVGGMSLLVALQEGRVHPDMPACHFIESWKKDPKKFAITLRQLATHTSGLEDAEISEAEQKQMRTSGLHPHMDLAGWKGQFWRQIPDPFTVSRDSTRLLFPPGSHFNYSNPGVGMLTYAVTAALKGTECDNINDLLWEKIYNPLGIGKEEISAGYGKTFAVNGLKLVPSWGGGAFTANAAARIGYLMLKQGKWQGSSIIDSSWVNQVTAYAQTAVPGEDAKWVSEESSLRNGRNHFPASTMGWYSNFDGIWPHVPRDAFAGAGAGHQILLVIPSLNLVMVRFGDALATNDSTLGFWSKAEEILFNPLMDAISESPYPQSKEIAQCTFADSSEILRLAEGSDNWPITWANDDLLYTAYGDGNGFQPYTDLKLSLGLASVGGYPPNVQGTNIRSITGERVGQGKYGIKASGILAVDNTLYLLTRNASNAQLAWSENHGETWTWEGWRFEESFGCPTFLNYGQNYQDAPDQFVYVYSPDDASAYQPADNMVLARVAKQSIKNRREYQFLSGWDQNHNPIWSPDIKQRIPVFTNPGKCYRSGISYNAALGKYLWCQIIPLATDEKGPRFRGGLGIFSSSHPWGPWETVFYTRDWDVGPGETTSIPTKWMSKDGLTCYLVFSGDDCFSVREVRFE